MRMIVLAGSELAWPRSHDRHRESGHPSSWVTRDRRKPGHRPLDHGQQLDHRYQEAKGTGSGGPLESANICSLWSDPMHYEVAVTVQHPLDANTERFLASVQRSANRVLRFRGDHWTITLTVEVAGLSREDAIRGAAGEVARIFPASCDEKYSEPRQCPAPSRRGRGFVP